MSQERHPGGCLCGALRYEGVGAIKGLSVCHCRKCQRWTGGAFHAAHFENGVSVTQGEPRWYGDSDIADRGSCPNCGSPVLWRIKGDPPSSVTAGSLDDPDAVEKITEHIFIDFKPHWLTLCDDAPRQTEAEVLEANKDALAAIRARNAQ